MKKLIALIVGIAIFSLGTDTEAHSGRTDATGGHNCSEKSKAKGLCSGYHYHNGDKKESRTSSQSNPSSSNQNRTDKDCNDFATYDEVVAYWNSKGYSAANDPENLDGLGNGVIDDGIPCEAPDGYDKTKINNSDEQILYNLELKDRKAGEKQGYLKGQKDGYNLSKKESMPVDGSHHYKESYQTAYNKGYDEGQSKIESEKNDAYSEGTEQGKKGTKFIIPKHYASHPELKETFTKGFKKAEKERKEVSKREFFEKGYDDGKQEFLNVPTEVETLFIEAYRKGYDQAQRELKEEYKNLGYEDAFKMLDYKEPAFPHENWIDWYKEGFHSNREITGIKEAALSLGREGKRLVIPADYRKAESIFVHYYELGRDEYKQNKDDRNGGVIGGTALLVFGWLSRRFYVAKKMIK
ncbi:MAG: YHYH domain-containing protein [Bacillus sp. (in: firmicutes)]